MANKKTTEDTIVLKCRHCGQKNKVSREKSLYQTDSVVCGKCKKNIFLATDEKISFLNYNDFIHPLDASTMKTLQKIPAIHSILKFIVSNTSEKFYKILYYQNYLKVSEEQFPELYKIYKKMLAVYDFDYEPEFFVFKYPFINAHTFGVEKHFVGITTAALEELTDDELANIIAHELAHIKLNHVLYKMSARLIGTLSVLLGDITFGIGRKLIAPLEYALLAWDRASELSADRLAVLATKKLHSAHTLTLKLAAGVRDKNDYDFRAFLEQGDAARKLEDESIIVKVYSFFKKINITHPFPVWRAGELDHWARNGSYLDAISGNFVTEKSPIPEKTKCQKCGNEYSSKLQICPFCGHSDKSDDSFFDKFKSFFA
ncbi:M48 family metallopeptidase [bacterium]|nr:M48 family metallopeptidase [bacterium]